LIPLQKNSNLAVLADVDPASQILREAFCAELAKQNITCANQDPNSVSNLTPGLPDLTVWISLQTEPILPLEILGLPPEHPALAISLSPPPVTTDLRQIFGLWIGPDAWHDQEFLDGYAKHFKTPPVEFSAYLAYTSTNLIHQVALETAQRLWDGSWILPRQVFQTHLFQRASQSGPYQYSCTPGQSNCLPLPVSLYRWSGKEYRFDNP
jgi:hypothetical protein